MMPKFKISKVGGTESAPPARSTMSMQTILVQSAYMLLPGAVLYMIMKCDRFCVAMLRWQPTQLVSQTKREIR